jgi:Flp pilus assembly protein TadD
VRNIALPIIATAVLLLSLCISNDSIAAGTEQQVCEVHADYSLGIENYAEAIRRHLEVLRQHPDNALAHYHLGFALGMVGYKTAEIEEYHHAEALGLKTWDLFLNLGLAQLEDGDLNAATESLRHAVFLGEDHFESHFNLALVEERRGLLAEAEHEAMASLLRNPREADARNLLGVIYAQEGKTDGASVVWSELIHDMPNYQAARLNLAILGSQRAAANGETAAVAPPTPAARRQSHR